MEFGKFLRRFAVGSLIGATALFSSAYGQNPSQIKTAAVKSSPGNLEKKVEDTRANQPASKPVTKELEKAINYRQGPSSDHKFLIDNAEFENESYASQKEIQDYLEKREYALARPVDGKLFSEEICNAAKKYDINPLLLLTRAEVEKGAVRKKALSEKQIKELMGYDIPDSGRRNQKTLGFSMQIERSAKCLRKHYNGWEAGKTLTIDYGKAKVIPENAASYALYRYTPHWTDTKLKVIGGGNYLVTKLYNEFKQEIKGK